MTVGAARRPYGQRVAVIGDMAVARLYKDGILSAWLTASALADCIFDLGVDRQSLRHGYWPAVRRIAVLDLSEASHGNATGVGLADCERMSRELDDDLERLSFFESPYELQVSSPGIDRPIRSDDDIRRNTGRSVRVEFRDDQGKVREVVGTLTGSSGAEAVTVGSAAGVTTILRDRIILMKQVVAAGGRLRDR